MEASKTLKKLFCKFYKDIAKNLPFPYNRCNSILSVGRNIMNDMTAQFAPEDIQKNKVIAALSYLGILFFLPLVAAPESRFGKFHANQSLVLLLAGIAGAVAISIVSAILTLIWWRLAVIISVLYSVFGLALTVFAILGLVYALQGKAMELPLLNKIKIINY